MTNLLHRLHGCSAVTVRYRGTGDRSRGYRLRTSIAIHVAGGQLIGFLDQLQLLLRRGPGLLLLELRFELFDTLQQFRLLLRGSLFLLLVETSQLRVQIPVCADRRMQGSRRFIASQSGFTPVAAGVEASSYPDSSSSEKA